LLLSILNLFHIKIRKKKKKLNQIEVNYQIKIYILNTKSKHNHLPEVNTLMLYVKVCFQKGFNKRWFSTMSKGQNCRKVHRRATTIPLVNILWIWEGHRSSRLSHSFRSHDKQFLKLSHQCMHFQNECIVTLHLSIIRPSKNVFVLQWNSTLYVMFCKEYWKEGKR